MSNVDVLNRLDGLCRNGMFRNGYEEKLDLRGNMEYTVALMGGSG